MEIVDLKSLHRDDDGIYYRRKFTGTVAIRLINEVVELSIMFIIETDALGTKSLDIQLDTKNINYPIVPIMTKLRTFINNWDVQGKLP